MKKKISVETISFEQEIPNLVLYRDYYVNVPLITNGARYCTISNLFLNDPLKFGI